MLIKIKNILCRILKTLSPSALLEDVMRLYDWWFEKKKKSWWKENLSKFAKRCFSGLKCLSLLERSFLDFQNTHIISVAFLPFCLRKFYSATFLKRMPLKAKWYKTSRFDSLTSERHKLCEENIFLPMIRKRTNFVVKVVFWGKVLHMYPKLEHLQDLVRRMLQWAPSDRISAAEALNHPYFTDCWYLKRFFLKLISPQSSFFFINVPLKETALYSTILRRWMKLRLL